MEEVKPLSGEVYWEVTKFWRASHSVEINLSVVGSYSVLAGARPASTSLGSSLAMSSILHMAVALCHIVTLPGEP